MHRHRNGIVLFLLLGLLVAAASGVMLSTAQQASKIGYIDSDGLLDAYAQTLLPVVLNERDRLQSLFDEESAGLDDEAKQALFAEYERRLDEFSQGVERQMIQDVERVLAEVAKEAGVDVVFDARVVYYGGVDLTLEVAERLGLLEQSSGE